MVTPEDQVSPEETSASSRTDFSTRAICVALLFAVALIAHAFSRSAPPEHLGFFLWWIISMTLLAAIVVVERRSISPRTLSVLLWGIVGVVLERLLGIILRYDLIPPLYEELVWGDYPLSTVRWVEGLLYGFFGLVGFSVGVFAGLMWPARLLAPVLDFSTSVWLRLLVNIVLVALVIHLLTSTIVYGLNHVPAHYSKCIGCPTGIVSASEYSGPIITIFVQSRDLLSINTRWFGINFHISSQIFSLIVVPILLTLAATLAGAGSQTRRALLGGTVGLVFCQLANIALLIVEQVGPIQLSEALRPWIPIVPSFVGFALGAWVGIKWPDSLTLRWLPWVRERSIGVRSLILLPTSWICAFVLFWAASRVVILLIGDPYSL